MVIYILVFTILLKKWAKEKKMIPYWEKKDKKNKTVLP